MTLTSTGPSGFHIKSVVSVLAVVAFVAGVYAISQQFWTDSHPSASAPGEAVVDTAEPYTSPSGLSEAYAAGKFDAGLNPVQGETLAGSESAPDVIAIAGQGSLYDALVKGKYDVDFLSGASGAQYVLSSEAAAASNRLAEALAAGKLDAGFAPQPSEAFSGSGSAPEIVVEGQGSLYDALIEGKYDVDSLSGTSNARYALGSETATDSSGLWAAFTAGQLAEGFGDQSFAESAAAAIGTPTVSGGHQE